MRERMERLVLLPFSVGCISESSVALGVQQPRRSKTEKIPSPIRTKEEEEDEEDEEILSVESMKNSFKSLSLPKPDTSNGIQRMFKGFKNFSQIFAYKEEMEEEDEEIDIQIGCPTDVKHVTHIGLESSATTDPMKGWENIISPDLISVPPVSWHHQFDLSMATQPNDTPNHLVLKASAT